MRTIKITERQLNEIANDLNFFDDETGITNAADKTTTGTATYTTQIPLTGDELASTTCPNTPYYAYRYAR